MRFLASFRHARALVALGLTAAALTGVPMTARADTTGGAAAEVRQLLAKVHALQAKVTKAESAYDRSLTGVARSVTLANLADRTTETVTAQTAAAYDEMTQRVRALYMSGGPAVLYASVLQSGSLNDFQTRTALIGSVVAAEQKVVQADRSVVTAAATRAAHANASAHRYIQTERDVAQAASRVQTLLAQEQQLLDVANAKLAHLKAVAAARAALALASTSFGTITTDRIASMQVLPPSPLYLSLYHRGAATCPGLSWTVLAAIGQVESGHGRNPSTSYAGAMGPMQFLPSTFDTYAVDGDHDGTADIMDPADAIFTAAHYLCANGGGRGPDALANAIWHYNHADWYVQMVLALAQRYAG